MQCHKTQKFLLAYAENTLEAALRPLVQDHLGLCSTCRGHFESMRAISAALKRTPAPAVPDSIWETIARETADLPVGPARAIERAAIWEKLSEIMQHLSWNSKVAFSSAFTLALAILMFWGTIGTKHVTAMQVEDMKGNPISAFPVYFREHHNPAGQPISDGEMALAFNTIGESR